MLLRGSKMGGRAGAYFGQGATELYLERIHYRTMKTILLANGGYNVLEAGGINLRILAYYYPVLFSEIFPIERLVFRPRIIPLV